MWSAFDRPEGHVNKFGVLIITHQGKCCAQSHASGNNDELNYFPSCLLGPILNKTDPHRTVFQVRPCSGR